MPLSIYRSTSAAAGVAQWLSPIHRDGISMSENQDFRGWSNYPTWCVNLWLSNDERLYNAILERLRGHVGATPPGAELPDSFKHWVRFELASSLRTTLVGDLLAYALEQVNWLELAEGWSQVAGNSG
jgi:hypothetical protein